MYFEVGMTNYTGSKFLDMNKWGFFALDILEVQREREEEPHNAFQKVLYKNRNKPKINI